MTDPAGCPHARGETVEPVTHYIADEDAEGWITCDCGLHYPDRARHDVHRWLEKARAALRGDKEETGGA